MNTIKQQLVIDNMKLTTYVIKKMGLPFEFEELSSVATEGLVRAANTYDPNKGCKFSTYAIPCIFNALRMYARKNSKHKDVLHYDDMFVSSSGDTLPYIETLIGDDDIEDSVELKIYRNELSDILNAALSERDASILCMYYGINGNILLKQREIGDILGITQPTVTRIISKSLAKVRVYLEQNKSR